MCSGRVDLEYVFRAFSNGMDGVFIGGCRLNECNYITHGNYHAFGMVHIAKKLLKHIGMNPDRLRIEFMSAGEGIHFAEVMNEFGKEVEELGQLGRGEGIDEKGLKLNLEAITKLIPYMKLVERESMRIPDQTEEAYNEFFTGDEFNRLFKELIIDKLTLSQIVLLLKDKSLSTGEIAEVLGLTPSEVFKYIIYASKQGLVRYDERQKSYALA
jgi:F420-non-reducing hydrogenase iron-sulfur subunit